MGTRNLTAVMVDGEYKIAQYGQWDGYPEGQGKNILEFLHGEGNVERLREALSRVRFLDHDGVDKEFLASYEARAPKWSNEEDKRTPAQIRWFRTYVSRDIGGEILKAVALSGDDEEILLNNEIEFAGDSLFCEWAYVVDLDKGTFEVYKGFNTDPVPKGERFADFELKREKANNKYTPVKLVKVYKLDDLPTTKQMVDECSDEEEE